MKNFRRKPPVIKVVKSSDFKIEGKQSLSLPWKEHSSPLRLSARPTWSALILCIEATFFLFTPNPFITIFMEWINIVFSLKSFYTQLWYTFPALSLTNPASDHSSPHSSSNSNFLEICLNFPWHNPSFCTFAHNALFSCNVLPTTLSILNAKLILI